ncbi:MAG: hypothetical protein CMC45_00505 [Flavobacteriaceae bacterium]|nr:hypothetical protein [Flavobacteriaceae bacterium]|tara:strand:- start:222 stop:488 length:267 start_codon:yes stop_codon:yes gene_type:complete
MELTIKCTENWKKPPNYSTTFLYEEYIIELDYNYDKDECNVKVDESEHIYGNNETLDKLVDGLSNSMIGLEWKDCEVGEEFTINPDHL